MTMAYIAILCAVTLSAFGTTISLGHTFDSMSLAHNEFSYSLMDYQASARDEVRTVLQEAGHSLIHDQEIPFLTTDAIQADNDSFPVMVIGLSSANDLLSYYGEETLSLADGSAYLFGPTYAEWMEVDKKTLVLPDDLKAYSQSYTYRYFSLLPAILNDHALVVTDSDYATLDQAIEPPLNLLHVFEVADPRMFSPANEAIMETYKPQMRIYDQYSHFVSQQEMKGLMLYVGAFLGLVVLVTTGSILYFRQVTEAEEEKAKYDILFRVGTQEDQVRKSIAKQVLYYFLQPVLIGLVHSTFALIALSKVFRLDFTLPVLLAFGVMLGIYGLFYVVTVRGYTRTALVYD